MVRLHSYESKLKSRGDCISYGVSCLIFNGIGVDLRLNGNTEFGDVSGIVLNKIMAASESERK